MRKPAKPKKPAKRDDGNLHMEWLIACDLTDEDIAAYENPFRKSGTDLDAALSLAADGWLDPLRREVVKIAGDERVGLFINEPKGQRGKRKRRILFEAVGATDPCKEPTLIQLATRTKQRIQQLFNTKYPLRWRRENGVTWSAAYLAARQWLRDGDGELYEEELVDALVQMIEHRAKQGIKRKRPASK
jgi:hypothetical protein